MKKINLLFLCAVAVALAACGGEQNVAPKVQIKAVTLKDTTIEVKYYFPATIRGIQDIEIYPQVSGRIMEVLVKEGQKVKKGQPLFALDSVTYHAVYEEALANVEVAKARLESAKLTAESKTNLYKRDVISEYQLKLAIIDSLSAEAELLQAKAALRDAVNNLSYTKVRTLVSGNVGSLPFKVGSLVSPSITVPLTIVSDNSQVYADFSIPENMYLMLIKDKAHGKNDHIDIPLGLVMNDGTNYPFDGKLYSMSGLFSEESGALPLRALYPNPDGVLLSGGACQVELSYVAENQILVPRVAIREVQDKYFVFTVKDSVVSQTPVLATRYDDQNWQILPDADGNFALKAGDVISSTANRLKDGDQVKISE